MGGCNAVVPVDPRRVNGTMPVPRTLGIRRLHNKNEEGKVNVLTLMVIIILAYWVIAMYLISRNKDWD